MLDFTYRNGTELIFGKHALDGVGDRVRKYGKRALVVYGGTSCIKNGVLPRVRDALKQANVEAFELPGVRPNPEMGLARKGIEICRRENVEVLLAIGGGSVIDTCKTIGMGVLYEGDPWDLFCGTQAKGTLPVGVVLTIPAAGSESSTDAVMTEETAKLKRASCAADFIRPVFALLDPQVTFTLPPYQTACGVCDMIAHVLERYFTTTPAVDVTDRLSEGLILAIMANAKKVIEQPENYDARAEIMLAGTYAHNGSLGVGRKTDWASHGLGHEVSALTGAAHGATLAVIMPAWMKYVYRTDVVRFAQFAHRVMGVPDQMRDMEAMALKGIQAFRNFLTDLGLPARLSELGITEGDIPVMAEKCHQAGGFQVLDCGDIENIYRSVL